MNVNYGCYLLLLYYHCHINDEEFYDDYDSKNHNDYDDHDRT